MEDNNEKKPELEVETCEEEYFYAMIMKIIKGEYEATKGFDT